jgi:hypothetical protein
VEKLQKVATKKTCSIRSWQVKYNVGSPVRNDLSP